MKSNESAKAAMCCLLDMLTAETRVRQALAKHYKSDDARNPREFQKTCDRVNNITNQLEQTLTNQS